MKIPSQIQIGDTCQQYCPTCFSTSIKRVIIDNLTYYYCKECNKNYPRLIVMDPHIVSWIDSETREYWHESVGIFLFNKDNEALFFERVIYPFAFTIPAGHLDVKEKPKTAVLRELSEEVGIRLKSVRVFSKEDVVGDECRRGADCHRWHLFVGHLTDTRVLKLNDEGVKPVWLALEETLTKDLIFPVRHFIKKYGSKLCA